MPERPSSHLETATVVSITRNEKRPEGWDQMAPDTEAWRDLIAPALGGRVEQDKYLVEDLTALWAKRWVPLCLSDSLPPLPPYLAGVAPLLKAWEHELVSWRLKQVGTWPQDLAQLPSRSKDRVEKPALVLPRHECPFVKSWTPFTRLTLIPAPGLEMPWVPAVIQWPDPDLMDLPWIPLEGMDGSRIEVEGTSSLRWEPPTEKSRDLLLQMAHHQGAIFRMMVPEPS